MRREFARLTLGLRLVRYGLASSSEAIACAGAELSHQDLTSTKDKPFRQEIYLGVYFNPTGFSHAENEAKLVGSLLAKREFSWEPYLQTKRAQEQSFTARLLNLWDKYVEHKASSVFS